MILAVVQARMSSSRLPGKVMRPILGVPMLARQIERVRRAKGLDALIIATSVDSSDDSVAKLAEHLEVDCFRGPLDDVLERYYLAVKTYQDVNHVVRLTGDCPLVDPHIIENLIEYHVSGGFDYSSNGVVRTFPIGLDAEIMTLRALEEAWRKATLPSEREHVTPYIYKNPGLFKLGQLTQVPDMSQMRWTVDHPEDFEFVTRVFEALYPSNESFGMSDVLDLLLRRPEISAINHAILPHLGYQKSLAADEAFLAREPNGRAN